jgi:hypothetical protein
VSLENREAGSHVVARIYWTIRLESIKKSKGVGTSCFPGYRVLAGLVGRMESG